MRLTLTLAYAILVIFFALRRGDRPEKLVGLVLLTSMLVDVLNHALFAPPQFVTVDPGHLVIDSSTLVALLWIALKANRGWPLWVCAAQNIVILGHVGKLFEMRAVFRGYWAMTQVPILLQLAFLAVGTLAHVSRARRIGPYHSWRLNSA
jgi:hypothetical protein